MNSVRRQIIKKKKERKKSLGRTAIRKLLDHRSTADPVILFEGWGDGRTRSVSCSRNHYLTSTSAYSAARKKKRVGSRNARSSGKRKREKKEVGEALVLLSRGRGEVGGELMLDTAEE